EIYLHVVWRTKDNMPLLVPKVQAAAYHHIRGKLINTPGVCLHEIGGIEDHVHVAVSVAPTVLICDLVGQIKGASAHYVNHTVGGGQTILQWQSGYGVVSFGGKNLDWVRSYIRDQRRHHDSGRVELR